MVPGAFKKKAPKIEEVAEATNPEFLPTLVQDKVFIGGRMLRSGARSLKTLPNGPVYATPFKIEPLEVLVTTEQEVHGDSDIESVRDRRNSVTSQPHCNTLDQDTKFDGHMNANTAHLTTKTLISEIHRLRKEVSQLYSQRGRLADSFNTFASGLLTRLRQADDTSEYLAAECLRLQGWQSDANIRITAAEAKLLQTKRQVEELQQDNERLLSQNKLLERSQDLLVPRLASTRLPSPATTLHSDD